jgi:hypothetical protein
MRVDNQLDSSKGNWQRYAERAGLGLLLSGAVIFFLTICWTIVSKLIIAKGEYVSGTIFLVLILALGLGGSLLGLSNSSGAAKKRSSAPSEPASLTEAEATNRLLPEPELEPVPSITERTTESLRVDKKVGGS